MGRLDPRKAPVVPLVSALELGEARRDREADTVLVVLGGVHGRQPMQVHLLGNVLQALLAHSDKCGPWANLNDHTGAGLDHGSHAVHEAHGVGDVFGPVLAPHDLVAGHLAADVGHQGDLGSLEVHCGQHLLEGSHRLGHERRVEGM